MSGLAGRDELTGGPGVDSMFAGGGDDTFFVFDGDIESGEIYDGESGDDTLALSMGTSSSALFSFENCDLRSIERVAFISGTENSDGTVFFSSDSLGGSRLSNSLQLTGSDSVIESLEIIIGNERTVDLRGWTFTRWTTNIGAVTIRGSGQDDTIFGSSLADLILPSLGQDTVDGGGGGDLLILEGAEAGSSYLGGSGFDIFRVSGTGPVTDLRNVTLGGLERLEFSGTSATAEKLLLLNSDQFGGSGLPVALEVKGSSNRDILQVTLRGEAAFSAEHLTFVSFTPGHDRVEVRGSKVADILTGSTVDDVLSGFANNDLLNGGLGNDRLDGGSGADIMLGGGGNDTYVVDNAGDVAAEIIVGADLGGKDAVEASITHTLGAFIETLDLTGLADIDGTGNGLANVIIGNAGQNVLKGLGGADRLTGGGEADTLSGGAGKDQFIYVDVSDSGAGAASRDRILGFDSGADKIRVSAIDADQTQGGQQAFVEDSDGTLTAGEFRFREINGGTLVEFETDGAAGVEMQILVVNVTGLTAADLIL